MSFLKFLIILLAVLALGWLAVEALKVAVLIGLGAVVWFVWRCFYKRKSGETQ